MVKISNRVFLAIGAFVALVACGGGSSTEPLPANSTAVPLSLAWTSGAQTSSSVNAGIGNSGTLTVTPTGTPPYQGQIVGGCASVAQATTSTSFTVNVTSGVCAFVVQDATSKFREIQITGAPPRAFMSVTPDITDTTGTAHLSLGSSQAFTVNEPLFAGSFNSPYAATVFGTCVSQTSAVAPANAQAVITLTATASGQCVAVFVDSADSQAVGVNFTI